MRLAEYLINEKLITEENLRDLRDKQKGAKKPTLELLVEMGFVTEAVLLKKISELYKMPIVEIGSSEIDKEALKMISYETARRQGVFPLRKEEKALVLAMSDPKDILLIDDMRLRTKMEIKPVLSASKDIQRAIEKYYLIDDHVYDLLKNVVSESRVEYLDKNIFIKKDIPGGPINVSPIIRMMDLIFSDSARARASDIHLEPQEAHLNVRYRIDGQLKNVMEIPKNLQEQVVSRIKIISKMDIAEKRKPQDGRSRMVIDGLKIDLRISTVPTNYGEKVVIRLLRQDESPPTTDHIGLDEKQLQVLNKALSSKQGIVLVTGPTGSGKTSTLYGVLNKLKSETRNIVTIEDPIEYLIAGINQIQIEEKKDITFANCLRSVLRQDPNIILVGEIRDRETADIAFRGSQTGHLVLSTLHTNNSVATLTRLYDLGLEPYLISAAIQAIVAQRLARLVCPHCEEEYKPADEFLMKYKSFIDHAPSMKFIHGQGCAKCSYTGYFGRTALFEVFEITPEIRQLISQRGTEMEIFEKARSQGLSTLAESGFRKVAEGVTTLEELSNVVDLVDERSAEPEKTILKRKTNILVVDDSKLIREMVIQALSNDDFKFSEAEDGEQGLKLIHTLKPDLLISDVNMPKMDGFELVHRVRSSLETATIPIIMLTTLSDKENELKGIRAGADDYIAKPFDAEKLKARTEMILRRIKRNI